MNIWRMEKIKLCSQKSYCKCLRSKINQALELDQLEYIKMDQSKIIPQIRTVNLNNT